MWTTVKKYIKNVATKDVSVSCGGAMRRAFCGIVIEYIQTDEDRSTHTKFNDLLGIHIRKC